MKIFDAHNDFLTTLNYRQIKAYLNHFGLYHKNTRIIAQVWTTRLISPIKYIKKYSKIIAFSKNIKLGIEDLGFINEKNHGTAIREIIRLNPTSCGIVWNNDNSLGGGALGKKGISPLGEKVVKKLENAGILVDTAHMNKRTFYDFCNITQKPIFNSHCNLYELHKHRRNLDEEQVRKVISSSGLICLSFVRDFISKKKVITAKDIAYQISYAIKKYGYKYFAIGSDFFGTENLPNNLENYLHFSNLKKELLDLGISRGVIKHVFYKNLKRFINKNKKK